MILGLILGFGVGLNVGLWTAALLLKKVYKSDTDYYRKNSDEWFNEYIKVRGYYNEMTSMWMKEVLKNIGK